MSIQPIPPTTGATTAGQLVNRAYQNDQALAGRTTAAEARLLSLENRAGPSGMLVRSVNGVTANLQGDVEIEAGGTDIQVGGAQPASGWWLDNEIPDTTPPTAGTLTASDETHAGFTLTVTGASDDGRGLHEQPYRFSTDNGSSYGAWQSSPSWVATGLTAETTYQCRVEVRDAAGNTATAAANATTTAVPAETDPPIPGILAGSAIGKTGFTLTVTGASDAGVGLHAAPYAFSTDNGATWSAWQAGASYNVTGLTAETTYQCQHKTRDAAGNEATGAAITVTTLDADAADVIDTFTSPDGSIDGRPVDQGGLVWAKDLYGQVGFVPGTDYAPAISAGMARSSTNRTGAVLDVGTSHVRARISYVIDPAFTNTAPAIRLGIAAGGIGVGDPLNNFAVVYQPRHNNGAYVTKQDNGTTTVVGTPAGGRDILTGTLQIEWDGTTLTAWHNDNVIYQDAQTITSPGSIVGFGLVAATGVAVDNLEITYLP